ncbi:hypothetical protein MKW98_026707 [Papaver atlanticum]|uniref:Uncharacterized protein n=1 Tax=Papaver atlanticum TaxID=357466 RepID=A0AAD4S1A9_9MAGN|nr:hypothetical protein MKW98_026707 [Papaver atlanticum]
MPSLSVILGSWVSLQPENLEGSEKIVKDKGQKIRPAGSGLSPSGIGLLRAGMVNLALMDKVLEGAANSQILQVGAHGTDATLPPLMSKSLARNYVERQELVEHTFVYNMTEIKRNHKKWLWDNKHLKQEVQFAGSEKLLKSSENDEPDINELSFTELRDKLLALDPLDTDHVIKSHGYRLGWSDEILGFVVVLTSGSQITASLLEA